LDGKREVKENGWRASGLDGKREVKENGLHHPLGSSCSQCS